MTKLGGRTLSIPLSSFALKQVAVAALHAAHGVPDHADDLRAGRGGQPVVARLCTNRGVEKRGGDIAVARVLKPAVKRPQHQDQATTLLGG